MAGFSFKNRTISARTLNLAWLYSEVLPRFRTPAFRINSAANNRTTVASKTSGVFRFLNKSGNSRENNRTRVRIEEAESKKTGTSRGINETAFRSISKARCSKPNRFFFGIPIFPTTKSGPGGLEPPISRSHPKTKKILSGC